MWNKRDEEGPAPAGAASELPRPAPASGGGKERRRDISQIGKSLKLKGEISGSDDVYVDGEIEGTLELEKSSLTVGPNGRIQADVTARSITVQGRLQGRVRANERIDIRKTGSLEGDLVTARIMIEDGAQFRGSIDIIEADSKKPAPRADSKPAPRADSKKPAPRADGKKPAPRAAAAAPVQAAAPRTALGRNA